VPSGHTPALHLNYTKNTKRPKRSGDIYGYNLTVGAENRTPAQTYLYRFVCWVGFRLALTRRREKLVEGAPSEASSLHLMGVVVAVWVKVCGYEPAVRVAIALELAGRMVKLALVASRRRARRCSISRNRCSRTVSRLATGPRRSSTILPSASLRW
jgi:hypothetical protein